MRKITIVLEEFENIQEAFKAVASLIEQGVQEYFDPGLAFDVEELPSDYVDTVPA